MITLGCNCVWGFMVMPSWPSLADADVAEANAVVLVSGDTTGYIPLMSCYAVPLPLIHPAYQPCRPTLSRPAAHFLPCKAMPVC